MNPCKIPEYQLPAKKIPTEFPKLSFTKTKSYEN